MTENDWKRFLLNGIRIIGRDYRIHEQENLHSIEDREGDHTNRTRIIRVDPCWTLKDRRETVLHETMHAIEDRMDINVADVVVRRFSVGLDVVLDENLALLALYAGEDT